MLLQLNNTIDDDVYLCRAIAFIQKLSGFWVCAFTRDCSDTIAQCVRHIAFRKCGSSITQFFVSFYYQYHGKSSLALGLAPPGRVRSVVEPSGGIASVRARTSPPPPRAMTVPASGSPGRRRPRPGLRLRRSSTQEIGSEGGSRVEVIKNNSDVPAVRAERAEGSAGRSQARRRTAQPRRRG